MLQSVLQAEFAGWIGVGREDITPPVGIYARNWGAAEHDVAEGVHRPLTVTALTLQTAPDTPPLALAALDLGWWRTRDDERFVRQGVLEALGLAPARLMLALSHTHAGPVLCRADHAKPGGQYLAPYLEQMRDAVIRAIRNALTSAQPATLTWGTGRCALARNRDLPDPAGNRIVCGFSPDATADDTLLVGRVTAENGKAILATLVNYACHPITLAWENRQISPDFIGALRETVETVIEGAPCLFLQGASGELAPAESYSADTALADRHGRQIGYAALSALAGMPPPQTHLEYTGVVESGAPLAVWRRAPQPASRHLEARLLEVPIPLKSMPSLAEIDRQLAACSERFLAERLLRKRHIREAVGEEPTTPLPMWGWRVGDACLLGQPNEAYSVWQTTLRSAFPTTPLALMNVVNGPYCGYLPPESLYGEDLYPVWQTPFERGCLETLLSASAALIRTLTASEG